MFRVTSLTEMPEAQLNRWIKRIGLLLFVGLIAFVAFYVFDRYNPIQQPSLTDQQIVAAEQQVRANPADVAARGTLADLYVKAARWQDAIAQYDAIIAAGKDEELARIGRAKAYEALQNPDAAADRLAARGGDRRGRRDGRRRIRSSRSRTTAWA